VGEPAVVLEALRVLEMWIPVDPSTAVQALAVQPGGTYTFRYSDFKDGAPPTEASLTYEQVRGVLAKLMLKGHLR
jgi:hypothetical protein